MNLLFPQTPTLFGPFHIGMLLIILISVVLFARSIRPYEETRLIRMLHRLGLVMILMEIWKQWFTLLQAFNIAIPAKLYRRAELKSIKTGTQIFM